MIHSQFTFTSVNAAYAMFHQPDALIEVTGYERDEEMSPHEPREYDAFEHGDDEHCGDCGAMNYECRTGCPSLWEDYFTARADDDIPF